MLRPDVFAALLGLARTGSKLGDFWINAAKAVSTSVSVSLPQGSWGVPYPGKCECLSRLTSVVIAPPSSSLRVVRPVSAKSSR